MKIGTLEQKMMAAM